MIIGHKISSSKVRLIIPGGSSSMNIRKIAGGVAWFVLAAVLVLFNAAAAGAESVLPTEAQESVIFSTK